MVSEPAAPTSYWVAHVGPEFHETIETCRAVVRACDGLHHVGHYTSGVFDFGVDVLDELGLPERSDVGQDWRTELRRLGRQFTFLSRDLDRILRDPRTGALMRVVLQGPRGAAICDVVLPNTHLVGIAFAPRTRPADPLSVGAVSAEADRAMADLVTALRHRISLSSQNPGGWETATETGPVRLAPAEPHVERPPGAVGGGRVARIVDACADAVTAWDLHLVAYCAQGEVVAMADQLGHPALGPFFTQIAVDRRRTFYRGFARGIDNVKARFNRLASSVLDGPLDRIVLDVEQGGIFCHRLDVGEFLIGVTLDQSRMVAAEARLARLAVDCVAG